jgi:hypothetical protein
MSHAREGQKGRFAHDFMRRNAVRQPVDNLWITPTPGLAMSSGRRLFPARPNELNVFPPRRASTSTDGG